MSEFCSSAGSFILGEKKPKGIVSFIHSGAPCGGGKALSPAHISATAKAVSGFVLELGWNEKAGLVVFGQLKKMRLSCDPKEHARQLHKYYERLGIRHRAIVEDLEKGHTEIVVEHCGSLEWLSCSDKAACADARHHVRGGGRQQEEQSPKGFYFGENLVPKNTYNEVFTIAGVSPEYVRGLLSKAERGKPLTDWQKHNIAAVLLSAYYYCSNGWPHHKKLSAMLEK
jgi:hypothetical protein